MNTDYICEQRLSAESPELHRRFRDSVFTLQSMLMKYKTIFPTYTDHTSLHSMEVIDFCNALIGNENIAKMNADEVYVLLMSAYLHDSGMGISFADYESFRQNIDFGDYFIKYTNPGTPDIIRDFHHEFSGEFIKKYGEFFDIPSSEHIFAIVQVSRGHRKTDLYDEEEYPDDFTVPNGNIVRLPYLAALIRLADELDIAADRNIRFLYDIDKISNDFSRMEFRKHQAIKRLEIQEKKFVMNVDESDGEVYDGVVVLGGKLNKTLQQCRDVVDKRTPFTISRTEVEIIPIQGETY